MFKPYLMKLDLQFFSADGSTGGGGFMVSPEHLQNVYSEPSEPDYTAVPDAGGDVDVNSEMPGDGQPEMTEQQIQDLIDLGEGFGQLPLEEVRKGFLRQQDYTRKTQELSEFRKEFEQIKPQYDRLAPYNELIDFIESDPVFQDHFSKVLQDYFQGGQGEQGQPQPQYDPRYAQLQQQNQHLQQQFQEQQQFIQQWQEQQAVQKAQAEWNDLTNKFPDAKGMEEQIYQFAIDNQVNLDMAYRYLNFDTIAQKTQEQMVANQKKRQVARTTAPSNASGATNSPTAKPKSYADVLRAIQEEGYRLSDD